MQPETIVDITDANIFQSSNLVLSNVQLKIDKGEFVYLIGKTGSGKSSLLKMIYGDVELSQGKAGVAGFELNHIKESQIPYLRRKLGIVFQDFQLLTDRSINSNLLFVLQATGWKDKVKMKDRINEVLDKVGLATKGFKPEISKEQFEKDLEAMWEYCEKVCRSYFVLNWYNDIRVLREVIHEIFFDGNGFSVPYFGVYINEKPEDQIITDIQVVKSIIAGRTEKIPVTDFAKDTVMAKFINELYHNLSNWEH